MRLQDLMNSGAIALVSFASLLGIGMAQDSETTPPREETEDVITVRAAGQRDFAMEAFRKGDYARAEIEFNANARCALRRERNQEAAFEAARRDTARGETFEQVQPGPSGASGPGTGAGASQPSISSGPGATDSVRQDGDEPVGRTCERRGYQLYMKALSQLQLGKVEEAEKNLKRAVTLDKVLYDAHYRIALIALLEGDQKTARRELRQIETILKRCRDCEARDEIVQRRDHLQAALAGEVALN